MAKKTEAKTEKIEKEYTIPLREKCRVVPRYKKSNKAIKTIKEFLVRHMKIRDRDLSKIKIDRYLNEAVWFRGIKKPPIKIKVKAFKEGEIVNVELAEMPDKLKFKKLREEKREQKAIEKIEKKKIVEKTAPNQVGLGEGVPSDTPTGTSEGKETKEEKTEKEKKEDIKKEKEKKSAVVEAGQKRGKEAAKIAKHQVGGKTKQPKRQIRKALEK